MGHLGLRMPHLVSQFWISCKDCFRGQERHGQTRYSIKGTKRYMKIFLVVFREKISFVEILSFQVIF